MLNRASSFGFQTIFCRSGVPRLRRTASADSAIAPFTRSFAHTSPGLAPQSTQPTLLPVTGASISFFNSFFNSLLLFVVSSRARSLLLWYFPVVVLVVPAVDRLLNCRIWRSTCRCWFSTHLLFHWLWCQIFQHVQVFFLSPFGRFTTLCGGEILPRLGNGRCCRRHCHGADEPSTYRQRCSPCSHHISCTANELRMHATHRLIGVS